MRIHQHGFGTVPGSYLDEVPCLLETTNRKDRYGAKRVEITTEVFWFTLMKYILAKSFHPP